MKKAFTMIELIFVIVILGILAAVALPKFIGVAEQAREGNLKGFVGTLNRTVGPTLWSKAINSGNNGDISKLSIKLEDYTDIPKEIDKSKLDITKCNHISDFKVIAEAPKVNMGGDYNYYVVCRTGTNGVAPKFELVKTKSNLNLGDANKSNLYGGGTIKIGSAIDVELVTK